MIKSFLNYPGGKYKLINQLLPLFPKKYNTFIDMFTGSAVVSINQDNDKIYAYDINPKLISLLKFIQKNTYSQIIKEVNIIIDKYNLSTTTKHGYQFYESDSSKGLSEVNKEAYNNLRKDYNDLNSDKKDLMLYVLIIYGFNNQIRFNKDGKFNNPVGKRDFNNSMKNKLENFCYRIQKIDIEFIKSDFRSIESDLVNSFYYADPPYLITNAVYNENNAWNEKDEKDLLKKLDEINSNGHRFALSNVLRSKGTQNDILLEWSKKYNVYHLNNNYNNSSYHRNKNSFTDEVLITNY